MQWLVMQVSHILKPHLTWQKQELTRVLLHEPAEEHCAIHPVLSVVSLLHVPLTQRLHGDLSRERRRQVDTHQIHIRMQQHVIDPVSVEGHVHVARQLLRLLLRAAPQRLHREALVLQQRDDDPGRQTGTKHTHTGQHDCRARMLTHRRRVTRRVRVRTLMRELWPLRLWVPPSCVKPL